MIARVHHFGMVFGISTIATASLRCIFSERLRTERVIENTRQIRNAEMDFRQIEHRYASLKELSLAGLVGSSLGNGAEDGYSYELNAEKYNYTLSVFQDTAQISDSQKPSELLSLFLDDTGTIRVSVDPHRRADATSEPVKPKYWMSQP